MIRICMHCHRPYWRYKPRSQWETPGFCSWPCHDMRIAARRAGKSEDPGIPVAIIELIRSHCQIIHHAGRNWDAFDWPWPDCDECDRLEAKYAAALAYHSPPADAMPLTTTERKRA